jgi:hypothetical protein
VPSLSARDYVQAKRGGRATAVRMQPTGTAVTDYQVPLGNRHSLKEAGVIGLPSWSEKTTQTETWVKVSRLSATCPRRVVAYDGGRSDIDRCMEFGDEFDGASLAAGRYVAGSTVTVSGGSAAFVAGSGSTVTTRGFGVGTAIRSRVKSNYADAGGTTPNIGIGYSSSSPVSRIVAYPAGGLYGQKYRNYNGSEAFVAMPAGAWAANTYITIDGCRRGDGCDWKINSGPITAVNTSYPINGMSVYLTHDAGTLTVDWLLVRKYVASEPLAGTAQPSATNRALSRPMSHADLMRACCT